MTTARASRSAAPSTSRRTSTVIMIIGTVIAIAAAFGPIWAVRVGLAVAIAAAIFAVALAWRELSRQRRRHAAETLSASRAHTQSLKVEREHNAEVLKVVTDRNIRAIADLDTQRTRITGLRTEVAGLQSEVSGLRGDKVALTAQVAERDATIGSLRTTLSVREAELAVLRDENTDEDGAQVHAMPRRLLVNTGVAEVPAADELWNDGSHPTVVDLAMIDVPALPNYEEDRRLA